MSDSSSGSLDQRPLIALIPPFAGAVVAYLLRDVPEFAQLGGSLATILITGAPLYQRAVRSDKKRSPASSLTPVRGSATPRATAPSVVTAGPLTVALSVVLGAAAFWLIDVVVSQTVWNVLLLGSDFLYMDTESQFVRASLFITPLLLPLVFGVAVWLAHRLRDRDLNTLTKAVVIYVVLALATSVWLSDPYYDPITGVDIFVPLLTGPVFWATIYVACTYARRTQYRYDAMRTARPSNSPSTSR